MIITIIVLLILAGVTISQITGSENAMEKATEAREKNEQGAELDAIKLAVVNSVASDLTGLVNTTALKEELQDLVKDNLDTTIKPELTEWTVTGNSGLKYLIKNNGMVTLVSTVDITKDGESVTGNTIELTENDIDSTIQLVASPTPDLTINSVEWTSSNTSMATIDNKGTVTLLTTGTTTITLTANTSGGEFIKTCILKIDKPLEVGDTVNYSTSHNGVTLDTWKVFHIDSTNNYVWIILSDYLPYNAIGSISGLEQGTAGSTAEKSYCVKASRNRTDLIDGMGSSNWTSLKTGTLDRNNVTAVDAMGSPTLDLWQASWNDNHTGTTNGLYTSQNSTGYLVKKGSAPGSSNYNTSMGNTGTLANLYFPHTSAYENCNGYWLASPSATGANFVMNVDYDGNVNRIGYDNSYCAFRPVVCLPSSVFE